MKQALLFIAGVVVGIALMKWLQISEKTTDDIWKDIYSDDTKPVRVKPRPALPEFGREKR